MHISLFFHLVLRNSCSLGSLSLLIATNIAVVMHHDTILGWKRDYLSDEYAILSQIHDILSSGNGSAASVSFKNLEDTNVSLVHLASGSHRGAHWSSAARQALQKGQHAADIPF